MDDAQIATLRERHSVAEDTDTDADGNLVYVQFCGWDDSDDWPCEAAELIAALEASRAECARLRVAIGVAATQLDNLDQWHVVSHIRDDLRAALNGAADATVGSEPTDEPIPGSRQAFIKAMQGRG